jgi:hypothetical protein
MEFVPEHDTSTFAISLMPLTIITNLFSVIVLYAFFKGFVNRRAGRVVNRRLPVTASRNISGLFQAHSTKRKASAIAGGNRAHELVCGRDHETASLRPPLFVKVATSIASYRAAPSSNVFLNKVVIFCVS